MKTRLINLLTALMVLIIVTSCSTDEQMDDTQITAQDISKIKSAMMLGDWKITYYFDTDSDETDDFMGYIFTFNSDGILAVTNGSTALSGAWSITDSDNSNDDSSSSDIDFNILFSSPALFEELTDDWDIKKYSETKIELIDVSGGNGGTDLLTFEKM